uniref:Transcription factor ORG3-like n=1 Tax=Nicotiana tabacum TaxID=4097 RepID=A0A1S3YVZ5_TOBAC|nr:PREDICTED: transcription factor ORG3-like [Nicotiana tabacum]
MTPDLENIGVMVPDRLPATVARTLKYIPELKKEVERLTQKKEDLTLRSIPKKEYSADFNKQTLRGRIQNSLSIVSANQVGDREITIQISILKTNKSSFAEAISELEEEELHLLIASCFQTCKIEFSTICIFRY